MTRAQIGAAPPRIGLSTYVEPARFGVWSERAALLPASYVAMVAEGGGMPVLLPPIVPADMATAAAVAMGGVDGLVLTGGADVDPRLYGTEAHPQTDSPQVARDEWELALARAALESEVPVLAVCRGAQLLNVALGGSLHQHLPDLVECGSHRPALGTYGTVRVTVEPRSRLAAIVGGDQQVSCHHHQAIDRLGEGLAVCARADDGTVEAVELPDSQFVIGVQWHPEAAGDARLFRALVRACVGVRTS
ncbi:MAG: gamma-glutamyl-gamma-aminobutyrate hydrolase family protein [Actinomycetota bacterium]